MCSVAGVIADRPQRSAASLGRCRLGCGYGFAEAGCTVTGQSLATSRLTGDFGDIAREALPEHLELDHATEAGTIDSAVVSASSASERIGEPVGSRRCGTKTGEHTEDTYRLSPYLPAGRWE